MRPLPPPEPVVEYIPPIQQPTCYEESYYVSVYRSARDFEVSYFQSREAADAERAVELFAGYLECAPSGAYAMSAHLRKARLHCATGEGDLGREELQVLAQHPDAGGDEVIDARYVYDYCAGVVDFRGRPLPRAIPPR
jgi:hypothetical protein